MVLGQPWVGLQHYLAPRPCYLPAISTVSRGPAAGAAASALVRSAAIRLLVDTGMGFESLIPSEQKPAAGTRSVAGLRDVATSIDLLYFGQGYGLLV